jgi:hypothetical protein
MNIGAFPTFLQDRREVWTATVISGSSDGGRGLIWPFFLAVGRTLPSVALERMTIERLTLALAVAAAAALQ